MSLLQLFTRSRWLRIGIVALVIAVIFTRRGRPDNAGDKLDASDTVALASTDHEQILSAGFVITDRVFNSELMAPYDVLHHTIFRDENSYIEPFIVSENGLPITSFEGITVLPHFSFKSAPDIDILVIPSANGSMTTDLENERLMAFLGEAVEKAQYVITLCDGAFPLAATGALNGKTATTFPGDRRAFAEAFPDVDVRFDVRFVQDGKFITSVGGGMSYEPALYLVEMLYGKEHADQTAEGLVWDWNVDEIPHTVISE
ncbi:MAG: DJ-1/PfpI family protein [Bacteroidetes bacterium]|nr:DJ-1/PfpI family protein [Bacteroidota bacterium]